MKLTFLSENIVGNPICLAEHGLSVYIETEGLNLLFDTGAGFALPHNFNALDIDPKSVDDVIISHGHYDHTQGVQWFCKHNDKAKIYIHEKSFARTFGMENGQLSPITCGIRWTQNEFDEIRSRLSLTKGVTKLSEDVIISGTIPDLDGFASSEKFYIKDKEGNLTIDPMDHEQFLLIRKRDDQGKSLGVYLFSGCSHKGIMPAIHYAKNLLPGEKLLGVVAGLHLYKASAIAIRAVLKNYWMRAWR